MPGFSGEQVVDTLALLERPPKVLVITGFAMPDVGERLRRIPCVVDLLVKPFDVLKFGRRIQAMLAEDVRGRSEPPREQGATLF
jgi:FixJ family two-component response regulator